MDAHFPSICNRRAHCLAALHAAREGGAEARALRQLVDADDEGGERPIERRHVLMGGPLEPKPIGIVYQMLKTAVKLATMASSASIASFNAWHLQKKIGDTPKQIKPDTGTPGVAP